MFDEDILRKSRRLSNSDGTLIKCSYLEKMGTYEFDYELISDLIYWLVAYLVYPKNRNLFKFTQREDLNAFFCLSKCIDFVFQALVGVSGSSSQEIRNSGGFVFPVLGTQALENLGPEIQVDSRSQKPGNL